VKRRNHCPSRARDDRRLKHQKRRGDPPRREDPPKENRRGDREVINTIAGGFTRGGKAPTTQGRSTSEQHIR